MRQKALDKSAAKTAALEAAELARIQKEIATAQAIEKKEAIRSKKLETENRQKREANLVYASYKQDILHGSATFQGLSAPVISSAYKYFVKLYLQPNAVLLTKKSEKMAALQVAFLENPAACDIVEEVDEDANNSDEEDV